MITAIQGGTIDRDMGWKRILEEAKALNGAVVESGLFEGEKHPEGGEYTVAQIGAVNEFGTRDGKIPERSWLRRAVRENHKRWEVVFGQKVDAVIGGQSKIFSALLAFGERMASDIRKTIDAVLSPPKAESTLRSEGGPLRRTKTGRVRKGAREYQSRFTHPLIWTGTMRNCVRSRVRLLGKAPRMTAKGR